MNLTGEGKTPTQSFITYSFHMLSAEHEVCHNFEQWQLITILCRFHSITLYVEIKSIYCAKLIDIWQQEPG